MSQRIKLSFSLLSVIIFFLVAFITGIISQIAITSYQAEKILKPITKTTANVESISQLLNALSISLSYLEEYRWEYGDATSLIISLRKDQNNATKHLSDIERDVHTTSREQYLLITAIDTTYKQFIAFQTTLIDLMLNQRNSESATLYYDKIEPCGFYLKQYCQKLLEIAILDNYETHSSLLAQNAQLSKIQSIVLILCILFGLALVTALFRLVLIVKKMARASKEISNGSLDIPDINYESYDEIGYLVSAFNEMKHSMKLQVKLIQEKNTIEQALLKKENESLSLQNLLEAEKVQQLHSQINPHFLFNTINVIKYTAQEENATKTESLLSSLGKIYRYVLSNKSSQVPLSHEIQIVGEFNTLYSKRFSDSLAIKWEIAPDLDVTEILVPSFILQPLVENAIKHGLRQKEEAGLIVISIWCEQAKLQMRVNDNGVGMSQEKLAEVKQSIENQSDSGTHIGLYNVATRLKLWNINSGLDISSKEGVGTTVLIWMPLITAPQADE